MGIPDLGVVAEAFPQRLADLPDLLAKLVRSIPPGCVVTYGDLAKRLGGAVASRWVASYLLEEAGPLASRSHRVVRASGDVGLYCTGNSAEKVERLREEGVEIRNDRVDLARFRFELPVGRAPLAELKRWQQEFTCLVADTIDEETVRVIGGLDVSYAGPTAVAVCSLMEGDGKTIREHIAHSVRAPFPYISGYLAFREIPVYLELLAQMQEAGKLPDILLVDGNGRLHPRRMGIATMLGGLTGLPTIGIAKSQLCGALQRAEMEAGTWEPIVASKETPHEVLGYGFLPHAKTKNPLFISQGFAVDDGVMQSVVERCFAGHRSPEPIYHADRESRRIASSV